MSSHLAFFIKIYLFSDITYAKITPNYYKGLMWLLSENVDLLGEWKFAKMELGLQQLFG